MQHPWWSTCCLSLGCWLPKTIHWTGNSVQSFWKALHLLQCWQPWPQRAMWFGMVFSMDHLTVSVMKFSWRKMYSLIQNRWMRAFTALQSGICWQRVLTTIYGNDTPCEWRITAILCDPFLQIQPSLLWFIQSNTAWLHLCHPLDPLVGWMN